MQAKISLGVGIAHSPNHIELNRAKKLRALFFSAILHSKIKRLTWETQAEKVSFARIRRVDITIFILTICMYNVKPEYIIF